MCTKKNVQHSIPEQNLAQSNKIYNYYTVCTELQTHKKYTSTGWIEFNESGVSLIFDNNPVHTEPLNQASNPAQMVQSDALKQKKRTQHNQKSNTYQLEQSLIQTEKIYQVLFLNGIPRLISHRVYEAIEGLVLLIPRNGN